MKVMAIDPGKSTGIAVLGKDHDLPYSREVPGGIRGFVDWYHNEMVLETGLPTHLAIENWRVRPDTYKKTQQPDAYLILGWVIGECLRYHVPLTIFEPSDHKKFSKVNGPKAQNKIVRLGWGHRTTDDHEDDACSVLLKSLEKYDHHRLERILRSIGE